MIRRDPLGSAYDAWKTAAPELDACPACGSEDCAGCDPVCPSCGQEYGGQFGCTCDVEFGDD